MSVGTRCAGTSCVSAVALLVLGLGRPAGADAQQAITATGTFHSVWVDPRNAPPPDALSFITTDQGTIRLELTDQQLAAAGGRTALERRRVTVTGVVQPAGAAALAGLAAAIGGVPILRVTALHPEQALVSATPQTGSRAYATILCRFPDLASVPGDRARYQAIAGTGEPGLDHYWREVSENQIDLSGSTVSDWYVLPHPYSHYTSGSNLDLGALAQDCTAAADADVNFNQVDGINLQFNAPFAASWGGAWTVSLDGPVRIVPMTWMANWAGQSVYAHEMGHSFGLPHSSGQYGAVYDSPWDVMSYSYVHHVGGTYDYIGQHTITYHKGLLGWIGTRSLSATGSVTHATLEQSAEPAAAALLEVRIPVGATGTFYTVEARRRTGYDVGLPREGVVIHLVNPSAGEPAKVRDGDGNGTTNDAGSAWTVGETFYDPDNHIAVRVEAETESGWEIYARSNTAILTATVTGPGTITASPGGISCPADCSEPYGNGEAVTLTATPAGDALFLGWSGACSGTGECVVSPSGDVSVAATFGAPETGTLDVVVTGPGSVTSAPPGITCPADCSEELLAGTSVTLTAVPATGAEFDGWGGACTGSDACVVTIGETVSVSAVFSAALVITSAAERPGATVGASYADQLEALAEAGTLTWSLAAGALPVGLELTSSGAISGIPEQEGAFTFTVRVASNGSEVTKELTLAVGVPVLDAAAVVDAVIAEQSALTADARRYLDLQGNRNGRVDAGDVRAWLQRNGVVPNAARQANTIQEKP